MFIQGDLQAVFDALYSVGAIDPVLKMDWEIIMNEAVRHSTMMDRAIADLNDCAGDRSKLAAHLRCLDSRVVNYIVVEVAREFADFALRSDFEVH